ncbi:MAG: c-type cytochrome [Alphaproteobacteria bacterium]
MAKFRFLSALLALGIVFTGTNAIAAGDAAKGKKVYKKCAICHSTKAGKNKIGPSLHGIFGRKAAKGKGFRYSKPMKKSGLTWDAATLDKFLKKPRKMVKRTRMTFPGLRSASQRANVIAYIKTLK